MEKDVVHTLMEYSSATIQDEIVPFPATGKEVEMILLSQLRETQVSYNITYRWS